MKVDVLLPRLSESMTEGTVTAWFANEGDEIAEGEAIAEIETEKSTVDLPAPASGVLARIAVAAGSGAVAVGTLLAEIDTGHAAASPGEPVSLAVVRTGREAHAEAGAGADDEAVPATPLARRMAAQAGLGLASLARTGIGGKVCKADVEAALGGGSRREATPRAKIAMMPARSAASARVEAAGAVASSSAEPAVAAATVAGAAAPASGDARVPLSRVRRTVAERMVRAKATIPHFYLSVDCRADRLLDVRRRLKDDGIDVSINDFVVRAAAIALSRVPDANASWNDGVVRHARIDIAVAVALEDGLVTPVVRDAGTLGLAATSASVRDLATRARTGALAPHEYDGATFTISNLGMHGVGEMFAIINPPQACILGVGAAEPRPVVEAGQVVAGTVMTLSLSADHRVLDGATGAKLLAQVRRLLEEPALMLA